MIGAASLINVLPYEVSDSWITVRDAEEPMAAVPAEAPTGTGLDIDAFQNLGYTAEWFVFAAFAVFMWFRLFRREVESQRDAELELLLKGDGTDTGTDAAAAAAPAAAPATAPATASAASDGAERTGSPAPPA